MGRIAAGLVAVMCVAGIAYGGQVSFVGEGFNPDPNQEVTVYVHTDTPLWLMWVYVAVDGDAAITTNIDWEDCNDYGWDPGWSGEVDISQDGHYTNFGGLSSAGDANGVVGYFKFIYHGGQVTVSMTGDGITGGWAMVPVSTANLVFGQSEQNINTSNPGAGISTIETPASSTVPAPRYSRYPEDGNSVRAHVGLSGPMDVTESFTEEQARDAWLSADSREHSAMSVYSMTSESCIVYDCNTVLTENTVWDRDVVLNGRVFVEGCMLVIKPGVTVWNSPDLGGIVVRNGGALVADGTNEQPVAFKSQNYYSLYSFAVWVDETASPATSIRYCYMERAYIPIWISNCRLDRPLEQVMARGCYYGPSEEGPALTDIINCEVIDARRAGIAIWMTPYDDFSGGSPSTHIALEHNSIIGFWDVDTGQGQDFGIMLYGCTDADEAGLVTMADNLIAGSFGYAVCMPPDLWLNSPGKFGHGYYRNSAIDMEDEANGQPWQEMGPHFVSWNDCPFINGRDSWPFYLAPDCNFVNTGAMTVEETGYLIGQSTSPYGIPDVNMADIGHHYNFEGYVNAGKSPFRADFNADAGVDANDLLLFSRHWLETPASPGYDARMEFVDANRIDFRDFAAFATQWKKRAEPIPPDVAPTFDQDPNNLKGNVHVSIPVVDGVSRAILLIDGRPAAEVEEMSRDPMALVQTRLYANGWHKAKVVCLTETGVFLTTPVDMRFNNELSLLTRPDGYEVGKDYCVYAVSDPNSYTVRLYDVNDTLVFEQNCVDGVNVQIPVSTFKDDSVMFHIETSYTSAGPLARWSGTLTAQTTGYVPIDADTVPEKFKSGNSDKDYIAQMVISIGTYDVQEVTEKFWGSCLRAARYRGLRIILLDGKQCTWDNLKYCLTRPKVKMWYHIGHGGYARDPRTNEGVREQIVITPSNKYGADKYVYSYKGIDRPSSDMDYRSLGKAESMPSIASLHFQTSRKLIWVQFDVCESGASPEFPRYLGMLGDADNPLGDSIFVGWQGEVYWEDDEDGNPNYGPFEQQYWGLLKIGTSLQEVKDNPEIHRVRGWDQILPNFKTYGVSDLQYAHFRYEGIN